MNNKIVVSMLALASQAQAAHGGFYNNQDLTFGIGSWNMSLLNYYICPGIMAGLFVFFFIMLIFLFATC
jgi:hypothetical protein